MRSSNCVQSRCFSAVTLDEPFQKRADDSANDAERSCSNSQAREQGQILEDAAALLRPDQVEVDGLHARANPDGLR